MFTVSLNKQVFVLYAGLVASGYDLTRIEDSDPMSQVVRDIKNTDWDTDALRYFSQARLQHGGVNPYWPRAAMLLHAALHLPPPPGRRRRRDRGHCRQSPIVPPQNALQQAIKEFPVDLSQKGDDTVAWVMDYPKAHAAFLNHPAMAGLWNQYQTVMGPSRLLPFEEPLPTRCHRCPGSRHPNRCSSEPQRNPKPTAISHDRWTSFIRTGQYMRLSPSLG